MTEDGRYEKLKGFIEWLDAFIEDYIVGFHYDSVEVDSILSLRSVMDSSVPVFANDKILCGSLGSCRGAGCDVYGEGEHPCWLLVGSIVGSEVDGAVDEKYEACLANCVIDRITSGADLALFQKISLLLQYLEMRSRYLQDLAIKDPLTHLFNRRFFKESIKSEVSRTNRHGGRFVVAMLDLDGFKQINDTFGHEAGDAALVSFAEILRSNVRRSDMAFRTGGDEFALLLPENDESGAAVVVQRLRDRVAAWNETVGRERGYELAFSAGWAVVDTKASDPLESVCKADARMYEDKSRRKAAR